jgi:hypothetical protein
MCFAFQAVGVDSVFLSCLHFATMQAKIFLARA